MAVAATAIDGLVAITAKTVADERGAVRELFRASAFAEAGVGVPHRWTQINLTATRRGTVRGLHGEATDKLVGVACGEAFGAYLDARWGSPSYGQVVTHELAVGVQMFVPAGVCNGFQALTDCQYLYCFGVEWRPGMEGIAVNPLDPDLGIAWPLPIDRTDRAAVSAKDATAPRFAELRG
jgi:dTDP-4-dehydrorhamnose 3,5-epimerase